MLLVASAILVTVGLVASVGVWQGRQILEGQAQNNLRVMADLIARELDQKIDTRFDVITRAASNIRVSQASLSHLGPRIIARHTSLQALFDEVLLFDAAGELVAEYPGKSRVGESFGDARFFQSVSRQLTTRISEPMRQQGDQQAVIYISAPVFDPQRRFLGVLSGGIKLRGTLLSDQLQTYQLGENGYIGVGTLSGLTVSHPDESLIMQPLPSSQPLKEALRGREGVYHAMNVRGKPSLMVIRQLDAAPWFVGVVMPEAEAFRAFSRWLESAVLVSVVVLAVLLPLCWFVFRRLFRPLDRLAREILEVRGGNRQQPVSEAGGLEIRVLAQAFNAVSRERRAALTESRDREAFFRSLWESAPIGLIQMDALGRVEYLNPAFTRIIGRSVDKARGRYWLDGLHPKDRQEVEAEWHQALAENRPLHKRFRLWRDDRRLMWVEGIASRIDTDNTTIGFVASIRDITAEYMAQEMLDAERRRATRILDTLSEGIILTDPNGYIRYLNDPAEVFLACDGNHQGRCLFELGQFQIEGQVEEAETMLGRDEVRNLDIILVNGRGERWELELTMLRPEEGAQQEERVFVLRDDSERRRYEERLSWEATHDALTHLANRRGFTANLLHWLGVVRNNGEPCALVMIDLDHFKPVNDRGGHLAGDILLKELGNTVRRQVRQSDIVARLGGDEFALLLPGCTLERAEELSEAIRDAIEQLSIRHDQTDFGVTASIGVTLLSQQDSGPREALARADEAAYRAKSAGRNRVEVAFEETAVTSTE
ncbi:diguanylate cyclase [Marinobacteraceae bacterium S3BR75-40.1]